MNKPRVAILHYAGPPVIGGVESTMGAHARLLARAGYPVKLIVGRGAAPEPQVACQAIPLLDSKHPLILEAHQQLVRGIVPPDLEMLVATIRELLASQLADVDVCIVHNALTLHKNLALTRALYDLSVQGKTRFIGWCHDLAWTDPVYGGELHPGEPWDLLRQRWPGVRYVVVSASRRIELAQLVDMPAKDIAVVAPGLDGYEFLGIGPTAQKWFKEFQLEQAAPLLLLPARVTRRKNIERAIEITGALQEQGLAPRLLVMGPLGPHNPANARYLKELFTLREKLGIAESVIFLSEYGLVDDATRRDLYLLADALLFTSEREGFGIPILEAGAARLPIFCSDIPAFHESAQAWAHYIPSDEPVDDTAKKMADFFKHDAVYQMKQRVRRDYGWQYVFSNLIEPLLKEDL